MRRVDRAAVRSLAAFPVEERFLVRRSLVEGLDQMISEIDVVFPVKIHYSPIPGGAPG